MRKFQVDSFRSILIFLHDVLAAALAWLGAYWLRFDLALPVESINDVMATLLWVVPLQSLIFWKFGLYRGIWRFASLPDLKRILTAVAIAAVTVPLVVALFQVDASVPRTVLILDPLLLLIIMGGNRFAYRSWKEHHLLRLTDLEDKPVLVLGAGSAADFLLRELARTHSGFRVIGLLDDDPGKAGRQIQGVSVMGLLRDLEPVVRRTAVAHVILALPSAPNELRKNLIEQCAALELEVLTVPSMADLMSGRVNVSNLRPIELDDLLGRDTVSLDNAGLADCLTGRNVMVTGAGGSIGAEMCRQIARFRPACLVLFEQSEFALYELEQEFLRCCPEQQIACVIGDVKDADRVTQVLAEFKPALIYHAAANKHVPLMEQVNALHALKNNVLGTWVIARAARDIGVEKFVMISTDKAVNPTNVMGASKRLAEMVCQSLQLEQGTRFVSVRFGNVLGSSGSVIPKFQMQIEAGGPVTVTHPEVTRFFMSIHEAAQLVLQAGLMGRGGEIFVLDMGEAVKIADLARLMIQLSGKHEDEIRIEYTGLRPGEKLYEEVLADAEKTLPTPHPKLRVARARRVDDELVCEFLRWITTTPGVSDAGVRAQLLTWLPGEYRPDLPQVLDSGVAAGTTEGKATSANSTSIESNTPTLSRTTSSTAPLG